ncbi:MAG TPA: class I SAM-dependent methyltransferase [Aldersonia sp.]
MSQTAIGSLFNATRTAFVAVTPQLWAPAGHALAYQLRPQPGEHVLDFCCGTGASALPAAAAVGPTGRVHAIDLADDLLEEGRRVASERALQNIDFVVADATTWEPPSSVPAAGYDALACAYGVFFLPDMDLAVARMLHLARSGGRFGVTVWRHGAMDEFAHAYLDALDEVAPEAVPAGAGRTRANSLARQQSQRLDTPEKLAGWLTGLGATAVEIGELSNFVPATEETAWNLVLGGDLRAPLTNLNAGTIEAVRSRFVTLLTERDVHTIDAGTLVGTAVIEH